jgi:predicted cupin superfamily sugar epimerase
MLTAQEIITLLHLKSHPEEGGFYRETYLSDETIPAANLPPRYSSERAFGTAIYYLLTPETCSSLHRLKSDEIFHFYLGDPVTMLQLHPDGSSQEIILGQDIANGHQLQVVVPRHTWQGSYLMAGGQVALMGTTMAPGFDYADFEAGERDALMAKYPGKKELIIRLT